MAERSHTDDQRPGCFQASLAAQRERFLYLAWRRHR
jgi:hypothetical protein